MSALNGLGNMHLLTGDYKHAIEYCSRATRLSPTYANAWADLFYAYVGQAEAGTVDLAAMRHTLAGLRATAKDVALLERRVPDYEAILEDWEKRGRRRPKRRNKGAPPRHRSQQFGAGLADKPGALRRNRQVRQGVLTRK